MRIWGPPMEHRSISLSMIPQIWQILTCRLDTLSHPTKVTIPHHTLHVGGPPGEPASSRRPGSKPSTAAGAGAANDVAANRRRKDAI
ncbi:hypothetical protein AN958_04336 [Leucoagaricus sp. SymC.cos]|nr:hypothetical protein AN958_04336 [Leucoagaricus sp. SymC.cos]